MEIMYPIVIIICLILGLAIFFIDFRKKTKYTDGKKVANTKYIKETDYYKEKLKKYKILSYLTNSLSLISIILASILIARPVTIENKSEDKYNRDILLGLDISTSESKVNLELINKFKEIIPSIKGDRIGIVVFNTAPVVYCPLTDDYEYINNCFDTITRELKLAINNNGNPPVTYKVNGVETPTIWYGGVSANNDIRGSSLVGDGLSGTIFSFPDLKKDSERTRIIIFATDNDVSGTETISLDEASSLCKEYDIKLYAYCPTVEMNSYTSEEKIESYKKSVENTAGGKFYTGDINESSQAIVKEIKETKTSLLKTTKKTYITDYPEKILILTIISFLLSTIIEKRMKI